MKKIFSAIMVFGLAAVLLVGCGSKEVEPEVTPVEDVTPEVDADEEVDADVDAEEDAEAEEANVVTVDSGDFDENGWKAVLDVTFDGDEIVAVNYDYVNEDGELKSEDEEYNTMMEEKSGVSAVDAMKALAEDLVAKQDPDAVDVVTGATGTSEGFVTLAKQAIEQK